MDVGKLFVFGFVGTEPTKDLLDMIRNDGVGGVILFRRNIESAEQLKSLTDCLQDAANGKLLIGIDQEGGRVSNLPSSIIDTPPMEKLGRNFVRGVSDERAHVLGLELGEKLRSLGINVDFAPVLDVRTNADNPIIGSRSFSEDPEVVSILGCELVRGMRDNKLISCGKHFPGHGDTHEDSHKTLPRLPHDKERLDRIELKPFKAAIAKDIPSLMTAHVIYEGVDRDLPATLSSRILQDILRDELGFDGVLFSDDLEMRAISANYDLGDASVMAIGAGCDMLLICRELSRQKRAMSSVLDAIKNGTIPMKRFEESLERIDRLQSLL